MKILVATHNKGKLVEFADMLPAFKIDWMSLDDLAVEMDVAETGKTFQENAVLKAQSYAAATGVFTIADDSGLQVDALDGAPGVYTARYGGPGLSAEARYQLLLQNLADVPPAARTARFRCAMAVVHEDGRLLFTSEGVCEGQIALQPQGSGGFGYDPVFYIPERGKTMAQLSPEEKHAISHRGRALRQLGPHLQVILGQND